MLSDPLLRPLAGPDGRPRLRNIVLRRRIGAGGMGAVYCGYHEKLDIDVAVKVLARAEAGEAGGSVAVRRFLAEARAAAKIDHPNLVRVLDVDEREGVHYIVMEHVRGADAGKLIAEKGPFDEDRALEIARAAAGALRAAHEKGIVHRDVKPANILIREEDGAVKLADLGLAKAPHGPDSERLTATGEIFGTPAYMSPEQVSSPASVDARADVYSLGATLYALLAGKRPFGGENVYAVIRDVCDGDFPDIAELASGVSRGTCELVRRMMKLKPAERPASMAEVVEEIDNLLRGEYDARTVRAAAPMETADLRRLEEEAMRAEAMGDLPSALRKYRRILSLARVTRVERRAREIEGTLPLWRAKQAAAASIPRGRWDAEEEFVSFARGFAAFKRRLCAVEFPSLDRGWEKQTRNELARVACDGRALVVGYVNGRIERVSRDGQPLWNVRPSRNPACSLSVCEAGGLAAAGYANGKLTFLRLSDGKAVASEKGHSGAVEELSFLEWGGVRVLVSLGADGVMKRWHPSGRVLGEHAQFGRPASFSPTTFLAFRGEEIIACPPPWKGTQPLLRPPQDVAAMALDGSGRILVLALRDGAVVLFSTAAKEELWRTRGLRYEPRGVFFAGERVITAWSAHEAMVWELASSLAESLDPL